MAEEVIVREEQSSPLALMALAVEKGFSTDQLKVLFDLHNQHNENAARQAFAAAKCETQRLIGPVVKSVPNPQTKSKYANLEAIDRVIRPVYTEQGLSLDFSEDDCPIDGNMRVKMIVTHKLGHQEERHLDLPIDGAGIKGNSNKTETHAKASTFTYGKRYLTVAYFNIPIVGEDDDGNGGRKYQPQTPTEVKGGLRSKAVPTLTAAAEQGLDELILAVGMLSPPTLEACQVDIRDLTLPYLNGPLVFGEKAYREAWMKLGGRVQQACKEGHEERKKLAKEHDARKKETARATT